MHRVRRITPGQALNYGCLLLARPIKIGFPYFNNRGECGIHEDYSRGLSEREIDTKVNNAAGKQPRRAINLTFRHFQERRLSCAPIGTSAEDPTTTGARDSATPSHKHCNMTKHGSPAGAGTQPGQELLPTGGFLLFCTSWRILYLLDLADYFLILN